MRDSVPNRPAGPKPFRMPKHWMRFFPADLRGGAELQRELAGKVIEQDDFGPLEVIGGVDVSYDRGSQLLYAAVVTLNAQTGEVCEVGRFQGLATAPYVPGFLSFREGPAVIHALATLSRPPDLLFCDGHGRAHPRRFGLACHLGIALNLPTLGAAKSLLVGAHRDLPLARGKTVLLQDGGETIGLVLRTRDGVRPIYISVGHRISLSTAASLVLAWSKGYRIPEPTRLAHLEVNRLRRYG